MKGNCSKYRERKCDSNCLGVRSDGNGIGPWLAGSLWRADEQAVTSSVSVVDTGGEGVEDGAEACCAWSDFVNTLTIEILYSMRLSTYLEQCDKTIQFIFQLRLASCLLRPCLSNKRGRLTILAKTLTSTQYQFVKHLPQPSHRVYLSQPPPWRGRHLHLALTQFEHAWP